MELQEGTTYETGCAFVQSDGPVDEEIPPPWLEPKPMSTSSSLFVVVDVETTGLGSNLKATQLAASSLDGQKTCSQYVMPECAISSKATKVTGITVERASGHNVLSLNGKPMDSCNISEGMGVFMDWLKSEFLGVKPILVAHNCCTHLIFGCC